MIDNLLKAVQLQKRWGVRGAERDGKRRQREEDAEIGAWIIYTFPHFNSFSHICRLTVPIWIHISIPPRQFSLLVTTLLTAFLLFFSPVALFPSIHQRRFVSDMKCKWLFMAFFFFFPTHTPTSTIRAALLPVMLCPIGFLHLQRIIRIFFIRNETDLEAYS